LFTVLLGTKHAVARDFSFGTREKRTYVFQRIEIDEGRRKGRKGNECRQHSCLSLSRARRARACARCHPRRSEGSYPSRARVRSRQLPAETARSRDVAISSAVDGDPAFPSSVFEISWRTIAANLSAIRSAFRSSRAPTRAASSLAGSSGDYARINRVGPRSRRDPLLVDRSPSFVDERHRRRPVVVVVVHALDPVVVVSHARTFPAATSARRARTRSTPSRADSAPH